MMSTSPAAAPDATDYQWDEAAEIRFVMEEDNDPQCHASHPRRFSVQSRNIPGPSLAPGLFYVW
jgi:hypothetical protein